MKEKIETKIDEYISAILAKESISHEDYMVLTKHLEKIKSDEAQQKWNDEKEERNEAIKSILGLSILK